MSDAPDTKTALGSKTIWANIIVIVLGILAMPEVSGILPPESTPYVVIAVGVLNLLLRVVTGTPITSLFTK